MPFDREIVIPEDSGSTPGKEGILLLRAMTDVSRSVAATCSVPKVLPARPGIDTVRVVPDSVTDSFNELEASFRVNLERDVDVVMSCDSSAMSDLESSDATKKKACSILVMMLLEVSLGTAFASLSNACVVRTLLKTV